jgi:hypothetical protein
LVQQKQDALDAFRAVLNGGDFRSDQAFLGTLASTRRDGGWIALTLFHRTAGIAS